MMGGLNRDQERAARYAGDAPLLVIAGAGSGKTRTLVARVARLIEGGADPRRLLLLTFTRRASFEMVRRARELVRAGVCGPASAELSWAGTFHAVANRLLRIYAESLSLDPSFTVLDRSDACDLINLIRLESRADRLPRRFPKKGTCLSIYSRTVASREPLAEVLQHHFPWCAEWEDELTTMFRAYVLAKQKHALLDYDDLLLYWYHLVSEEILARDVGDRFDHVLVDEYQDTNWLQAEILRRMKPDGRGVTAVGDDAQAIYSFRAATVRNILDFPASFAEPGEVITLSQNYRSTQPVLAGANAVISLARERYCKELQSELPSPQRPRLVTVDDEDRQVDYVVSQILANREAGMALADQAVLFRTAHHSDALEVELGRRNIPYLKFGGLKFLEAAHVKDLICVLRWAENPRDGVAAARVMQLLPGVGPAVARRTLAFLDERGSDLAQLTELEVPRAARDLWAGLSALLPRLASADMGGLPEQVAAVRAWYQPVLEANYDSAHARAGGLDQIEQIAATFDSRERFLSELTLDPPEGSGDHAGPPLLDEDFLILSTIHSAKGQEWDAVFVLNAADGCIPSDMATGHPDQIEEERRLLYVAMTRAKSDLHIVHPLRFFIRQQARRGDRHVITPLSRFLPESVHSLFERVTMQRPERGDAPATAGARIDVAARLRDMW